MTTEREALARWHDQLGGMIDQVGQPDYSLREMIAGMHQIRDEMFAALRGGKDAAAAVGNDGGAINAGSGNGADRKPGLPPLAAAAPDSETPVEAVMALVDDYARRISGKVVKDGDFVTVKFDIDDLHGRRSGIEALLRAMTQRAEQARHETALKCAEMFTDPMTEREGKIYQAIRAYAATLQPSTGESK